MDPLRWILDTPEVWWPFQRDVLLHRSTPRRQRAFDLGSEFFAVKVRTIELFLSLSFFSYLTLSSVFYSIRFDCSLLSTAFVFSTRRSVDTKQPRYLNGSFVRFNLIPFIRAVFCSLFIIEEENGRSFLLNVIVFLPSRCVRVPSLCLIEESDRGPATGKYLSSV